MNKEFIQETFNTFCQNIGIKPNPNTKDDLEKIISKNHHYPSNAPKYLVQTAATLTGLSITASLFCAVMKAYIWLDEKLPSEGLKNLLWAGVILLAPYLGPLLGLPIFGLHDLGGSIGESTVDSIEERVDKKREKQSIARQALEIHEKYL